MAARLVAFGEIMLRLSPPGHQLLMQSARLDSWVGGAEANLVTALARLGHSVGMISEVPDNALGDHAVATLRGHGVDTSSIVRGGGRMGLYFATTGAGSRPSEILYDRAGSSFSEAPTDRWDWPSLLNGADRLHLTGITPALGEAPAAATLAAARAAEACGVRVSFDCNYRSKLWKSRDVRPGGLLTKNVQHADILFGTDRDVALMLDCEFDGDAKTRRNAAISAAFDHFPKLELIASTTRHIEATDSHRVSARLDSRNESQQTDEISLNGIVDRIGGGDAFAAGVLHALLCDSKIEEAARIGLGLFVLKHTLPGDAALFGISDIDSLLSGTKDVRR